MDQNDRLAVQEERDDGDRQSLVVPVVARPSVSPLPSPETTPSVSREGTPMPALRKDREGSVETVIVDDEGSQQQEQEGMLVDEGAAREEGMEIDAPAKDDTLDILAANLREVRSLEAEQMRIEAEIEAARVEAVAKEKVEREVQEQAAKEAKEKAERDEAERKRKEEEAEAKARADRVEAEMRVKRLERLEKERARERQRAEEEQREAEQVRKEREDEERKEREKAASELAEAQARERRRIAEETRKETERQEREARAKARKEEEDRERALRNKEAFEREEREKMQEIERQAKARLEAEREKVKEAEAVPEDELHPGQREGPEHDYQQDYDLTHELEPESGIDPIYTQLGGPTPARSQVASSSSSPTLRRRLAPSATEAEIARDLLSPEIEVASGLMSPEVEIPKDIDNRVDTSDEGEQDELHDELDVDDMDNSPLVRPTPPSSFLFHSTPRKDQAAASSSAEEAKKAPTKLTQNRTVAYAPKAFKGVRSQPLLEIATNWPSQLTREAQSDEHGKRRASSESVPETPGPEDNEGSKSEHEANDMLPSPPTSSPFVYPEGDGGDGTKTVTPGQGTLAEQLDDDDDMHPPEPSRRESPEEQLFLPDDDTSQSQTPQPFMLSQDPQLFGGYSDEDEPPLPQPRVKSSWSKSTARSPSEEVPEATSTPKPTAAASKSNPSTVPKAVSTSSSSTGQGLPKTPTRSRVFPSNTISTPIPLSAGSGIGGRMNSHPASKTLVPTPSRKGALSRRFEEESRSRERSNSLSTAVAPGKKPTIAPQPSTPKAKLTAKKAPATSEVIEILSSPEISPRTTAQNVIAKRKKKLDAKDKSRLKDGDDDVQVKREDLGRKAKARVSTAGASKANTSNIVIDLTSDKDEEDDGKQRGNGSKAKGKAKESTKAAEPKAKEDDSQSDSDSDPDLGADTDDSAEVVAAVPVRRNLAQTATQSQQPSRLITDKFRNKSGQSAAATRVKRSSDSLKRAKDGDSDDDRPLKRARERSASRGGFAVGTVKTRPTTSLTQTVASGSKRKERERDADEGVAVKREKTSRVTGARESSSSTVASSSRTTDSGKARTLRARTVDLEAEPVKWPVANKHGNRNFQRDVSAPSISR